MACAADVLTFYQERLANELYLRTATERVSLQEMAKLIGYRLRPGVAAETWLAFALETPRTPPAGLPPEPGAFVTGIPTALTLASGLQVQSVPGPDEKPQTFETVEEITARPEWNAVRPWMSAARTPGFGATETWLQGVRNDLKPGDALLFVGDEFLADPTGNNNWDFRLIDSVEIETANDRTHVTWQRGLGSVSPHSDPPLAPQVHVLRQRAAVFGRNAPLWSSHEQRVQAQLPERSARRYRRMAPVHHQPSDGRPRRPRRGVRRGPSRQLRGPGQGRIRSSRATRSPSGTYVELYKVTSTTEVSRAEFAISGKVTRLGLERPEPRQQFFAVPARNQRLSCSPSGSPWLHTR